MNQKENENGRISKIEQLRLCHIELEGNRELILDGCKGILEYDDGKIKICTNLLTVLITGDELFIRTYTDDQIIVGGKIISIEFS